MLLTFLYRCQSTEMGTYTSVHIAGAHARQILLTSNVHVAAPYCTTQLKTQTRSCEISEKQQEVGLQGIRENDRLRSAKNAD